jgi:hypothetical protein
MPHFYCFSVEPLPSHPQADYIQGGWAHVIVRDMELDAKLRAMQAVQNMQFLVHKLVFECDATPEFFEALPEDMKSALARHPNEPIWVEIVACQDAAGPKTLGNPFEDEYYNN